MAGRRPWLAWLSGSLAALPALAAEPVPLGLQFPVNVGQVQSVKRPDVASNAAGGFVVVWERGDAAVNYPIFARTFDADGAAVSGNVLVGPANTFADRSLYPAVSSSAAGDFVVVWNQGGSDPYEVQGRRVDATGTPQGSAFIVAGVGSYDQSLDVASAPGGEFVVTWMDQNDATSYYHSVFARRYDAGGIPLAGAFSVKQEIGGWHSHPTVARDGDGDFTVVWGNYTYSGGWTLRGQRFDSSETPVGGEFTVTTNAEEYLFGAPQLHAAAVNGTGETVVAWQEYPFDGIRAQRYDASGSPVGGVLAVSNEGTYPDVALADDGDFVVVWEEVTGDGEIDARYFSAATATLGPMFQVNSYTTGLQETPAVAVSPNGFVVTWSGLGYPMPGNPQRVFARRYAAPSEGGSVGIRGTKLVIRDASLDPTRNRVVFTSRLDPGIANGAPGDPALLAGNLEVFYTDAPSVFGRFEMPSPWLTSTGTVAKYVNSLAPAGAGHVKVTVVKDGLKARVVAKGLGDGPSLDLVGGPPSPTGGITVVLTIVNGNDDSAYRMCTKFAVDAGSDVDFSGSSDRKLVARDGVPTACP
jgi:hypothetical protein